MQKKQKYKSKYEGRTFEEVFGTAANSQSEELKKSEQEESGTKKVHRNTRKKKRRKKSKNYLLRILVAIVVIVAVGLFITSDYFNVEKINIVGNSKYSSEKLIEVGALKASGNLFFTNVGDGIEKIEELPYVENVSIERKLPDTLNIVLTERVPVIAIKDEKEFVLIDDEGYVLEKVETLENITLLEGVTLENKKVGEKVLVEEEVELEKGLELMATANETGIVFEKIEIIPVTEESANVKGYFNSAFLCSGDLAEVQAAMTENYLSEILTELETRGLERGTIIVGGGDSISFTPEVR